MGQLTLLTPSNASHEVMIPIDVWVGKNTDQMSSLGKRQKTSPFPTGWKKRGHRAEPRAY